MNIEDFRRFCLSLPGVTEKMPFGKATSAYDRNLLVFSVGDKWFCFVNIDLFDFCNIKCRPEAIGELQARYDEVRPGYHMNKKYWISVWFNRGLSDEQICALVRDSYDLVAASLPKRIRETLQQLPQ